MFYVYIVASRRNGTLYTGHTDDLFKRIFQHRTEAFPGFSKRYGCKTLVWWEAHESREAARCRESQIKEWKRLWKLSLIEETNPTWADLYDQLRLGWNG
jgi:putative endonuclease